MQIRTLPAGKAGESHFFIAPSWKDLLKLSVCGMYSSYPITLKEIQMLSKYSQKGQWWSACPGEVAPHRMFLSELAPYSDVVLVYGASCINEFT